MGIKNSILFPIISIKHSTSVANLETYNRLEVTLWHLRKHYLEILSMKIRHLLLREISSWCKINLPQKKRTIILNKERIMDIINFNQYNLHTYICRCNIKKIGRTVIIAQILSKSNKRHLLHQKKIFSSIIHLNLAKEP